MRLNVRASMIEMILVAAILLLGIGWFQDCLYHKNVFVLPSYAVGSSFDRASVKGVYFGELSRTRAVGIPLHGQRSYIRGFREL
ncbi:hypothetical protein [Lunatimonas salinarum]|uniref:hypothetical protein n=1 Tax=Lunatimonas salinarum TaxID=1774590 RepID=UPI001ADEDB9C|nr:hypothetical protein [Lunatimonas salinarum]